MSSADEYQQGLDALQRARRGESLGSAPEGTYYDPFAAGARRFLDTGNAWARDSMAAWHARQAARARGENLDENNPLSPNNPFGVPNFINATVANPALTATLTPPEASDALRRIPYVGNTAAAGADMLGAPGTYLGGFGLKVLGEMLVGGGALEAGATALGATDEQRQMASNIGMLAGPLAAPAAKLTAQGASALDRFVNPANLREAAPEAFQYGRGNLNAAGELRQSARVPEDARFPRQIMAGGADIPASGGGAPPNQGSFDFGSNDPVPRGVNPQTGIPDVRGTGTPGGFRNSADYYPEVPPESRQRILDALRLQNEYYASGAAGAEASAGRARARARGRAAAQSGQDPRAAMRGELRDRFAPEIPQSEVDATRSVLIQDAATDRHYYTSVQALNALDKLKVGIPTGDVERRALANYLGEDVVREMQANAESFQSGNWREMGGGGGPNAPVGFRPGGNIPQGRRSGIDVRGAVGNQEMPTSLGRGPDYGFGPGQLGSRPGAWRPVNEVGVENFPSDWNAQQAEFPLTAEMARKKEVVKQGFKQYAADIINIPHSIWSAFDLSGYRQTAYAAAGRPKLGAKSFLTSLKSFGSEAGFAANEEYLNTRWYTHIPTATPDGRTVYRNLFEEAGIAAADAERGLAKGEGTFISTLVNQIGNRAVGTVVGAREGYNLTDENAPTSEKLRNAALGGAAGFAVGTAANKAGVGGQFYRASQRAYATMLNSMRHGLFEAMIKGYGGDPTKIDPDTLRQWGRLVNVSTGRGDLKGLKVLGRDVIPDAITQSSVGGYPLFWAPRLFLSRVQMPLEVLSSSADVRKEAARQLVAFWGVNAAIVGTGAAVGLWKTNTDPKSADLGQIILDDKQRIDPWEGNRPIVNLIARLATGETTSTTSGDTYDKDRAAIIADFLRSKFDPGLGATVNLASGEDIIGRPYDINRLIDDFTAPLLLHDIEEAVRLRGPLGIPGAAVGVVGLGTNTYETPIAEVRAGRYNELKGRSQLDAAPLEAWRLVQEHPQVPQQFRDIATAYGSVRAWQTALREEYRQQAIQAGYTPANADWIAAYGVENHPMSQLYSQAKNGLESQWIAAYPKEAEKLLEEDLKRPASERRFKANAQERAIIQQGATR